MRKLLEFLNSHGSVRRFTGDPISEEQERIILTTAERSPTSSNLHAYSIILVRDEHKKRQLSQLTGGQTHVAESALFLVFCADLYRLSLLNQSRGYRFNGEYMEMFIIAAVDAALAASRALLAAQAMGLGGVMVGGIRNQPDEVAELLKLPKLVCPIMGMSLGQPEKSPQIKPRLPLEGLAFQEQYETRHIAEAVGEYDREISKLGYLKGREVSPENYPDFAGVYSWSEHSARRMADQSQSVLRPHMKSFLERQGLAKK